MERNALNISFIAVFALLSVRDVKTRRVPPAINAGVLFFAFLWQIRLRDALTHCLFAAVIFGILLVGMTAFSLGGADAIAGATCGMLLGQAGIAAVALAFLLTLPYLVSERRRGEPEPDYAFFPYITAGYACMTVLTAAL